MRGTAFDMPLRDFLFGFLRQCAHASAAFLLFLVALERLAPASVLPYLSPFAWGGLTLALLVAAASPVASRRWRGWGMLVPAGFLMAWLLILLPNEARWTWLLVAACGMLGLSAAAFYSSQPDDL
jgi:hypothetical protein